MEMMPFDSSVSRREALRVLSAGALALVTGRIGSAQPSAPATTLAKDAAPFSLLTPELTEGPFYIDLERLRRDITEGKRGVPLRLSIQVRHVTSGAPIAGAAVDIWHCDAQGVYSGFNSHGHPFGERHDSPVHFGQPPPMLSQDGHFSGPPPGGFPPGGPRDGAPGGHGFAHRGVHKPDNALTFLRGVQITNADGVAEIDTIYPGWYMGRTTHIHLRVHIGGLEADMRYRKGHICHTGQIFFPEPVTDHVYALAPYVKKEQGRMPLQEDGIFRQGGNQVWGVVQTDPKRLEAGLASEVKVVVDPDATPAPA